MDFVYRMYVYKNDNAEQITISASTANVKMKVIIFSSLFLQHTPYLRCYIFWQLSCEKLDLFHLPFTYLSGCGSCNVHHKLFC